MRAQPASPNRRTARPWGRAAGLLTGCAVTLTGVVLGLSPEVIAIRAACSGFLIGGLTAIGVAFLHSSMEGG